MKRTRPEDSGWAVEALRGRGLRATIGRCCVLEVLADGGHLDVPMVAERVSRRVVLPAGSVPRLLADLRQVGLVSEVPLPDGAVWALTRPDGQPHSHTRCRVCGQVSDLPASTVTVTADVVRRDHNFTVDPNATVLVGLCGRCDR